MRRMLLVGVLVLVCATAVVLTLVNRAAREETGTVDVVPPPTVNAALFADHPNEPTFGGQPLESQLCTQSQFASPAFERWIRETKSDKRYHSKLWEYAYILQVLSERDMIEPGKKGLGYGVGREPLPSVMAKHGVDVLATDLDVEQATKLGWVQGNQHMSSIEVLNERGIATEEQLRKHVTVRNVDMNNIPAELQNFDFTWSTCSLGHLGNLAKGLAFIENSLKPLKPGGIAVHTTEFNLSSNTETWENENTSVYRRRDIEELVKDLTAQGHEVRVNFNYGKGELDTYIDEQFGTTDKHLRLRLGRFAVASLGLVIRKNPQAPSN